MKIKKFEELEDAKDQAAASRSAFREVKETLSLSVDVFNKAHLFKEEVEKEEKLRRRHIIRYLSD